MKTHKFDVEDAKEHGVKKAIILEHLKFHQQANQGHENLTIDGKTWAFLKKDTIEKMYPYFSYPSVKRWLQELEEDDIIESHKPRAKWGNHLKYYHVLEASEGNSQNENSGYQNENSPNYQNENSSIVTNVDNTNGKNIVRTKKASNPNSSQKKNKPSAKERTKKYIPLAKYLAKIVLSHIDYDIDTSRIKSWAKDLRLLHEKNKVHPNRQKKVLSWYRKNIGGDFVPEVFSGGSFREKFPKLEAAIKRQKNPPTNGKPKPAAGYNEPDHEFQQEEDPV